MQQGESAYMDLRKKLSEELCEVEWADLKTHLTRGALVLVNHNLDMVDVGLLLAEDKKEEVEKLIQKNWLKKPSLEEVEAFEARSPKFYFLIISPFVLIQDIHIPSTKV
jgi:hypothetical protein